MMLAANEIGGAVVRRVFNSRGRQVIPGTVLSRDEVLQMPPVNRNALASKKYIDLFPLGDRSATPGVASGERYVISAGFGKFFVIEGKKLNDEAISRAQAYALAGKEEPAPAGQKKRKAKQ